MYYGVQYYPEQWPETRWELDAQMMQRAGVNTVRMGEFAWSAYEPREGGDPFRLDGPRYSSTQPARHPGHHVYLFAHPAALGIYSLSGRAQYPRAMGISIPTGCAIRLGWTTPSSSNCPNASTGR